MKRAMKAILIKKKKSCESRIWFVDFARRHIGAWGQPRRAWKSREAGKGWAGGGGVGIETFGPDWLCQLYLSTRSQPFYWYKCKIRACLYESSCDRISQVLTQLSDLPSLRFRTSRKAQSGFGWHRLHFPVLALLWTRWYSSNHTTHSDLPFSTLPEKKGSSSSKSVYENSLLLYPFFSQGHRFKSF